MAGSGAPRLDHAARTNDRRERGIRHRTQVQSARLCALSVVVAGLLSVSCTKFEINDQTYQFNEATGNVGNQLLLLNAVRSAKGYPMQFTSITSYEGTGRISGSINPNIPFIVDDTIVNVGTNIANIKKKTGKKYYSIYDDNFAAGVGNTNNTGINFNTGVQKLLISELNDKEALKDLKTTLDRDRLFYYEEQGWNLTLLSMLTVEEIEITLSLFRELNYRSPPECRSRVACEDGREVPGCDTDDFTPYTIRDVNFVRFKNNPRNRCSYAAFRHVVELIIDAGFSVENYVDTRNSDVDKVNFFVHFSDDHIQSHFKYELSRRDSKGYRIDPLEFRLRSPERVVRYLGDLIAAQSLERDRYVPQIRLNENGYSEYVDFLRVVRNAGYGKRWAVSVKDPEGERFGIPIPDYGSPDRHLSLQTLALSMDIYNSAVSNTSIPPSKTILLRTE